ncbi:hypothetical protein EVAR_11395_1 [Eumeta japonica]|uniref:Uncharacterized protein n=1 Tax=Eumeta variegata TaxID=151549 RepID=A0A4C1TNB4_EUMVA|nr:hypothetical protein EVAR_11395_1 [Eumeta japonica]
MAPQIRTTSLFSVARDTPAQPPLLFEIEITKAATKRPLRGVYARAARGGRRVARQCACLPARLAARRRPPGDRSQVFTKSTRRLN